VVRPVVAYPLVNVILKHTAGHDTRRSAP
jgi:hypothetical protein